MKPNWSAPLLMCLSLLLWTPTVRAFTALYAFGDSLTDTGSPLAYPPKYVFGRFSNGPLWVEHLSPRLGFPYNSANNRAVAGSETSGFFGLLSQVNGFSPPANAESALFAAWSGGNDFLNNLSLGMNAAGWDNVIQNAVNNISNAVIMLYDKGARAILVPNLPDIGKTPRLLNGYSPAFQAYMTDRSAQFNASLAAALGSIQQGRPSLRLFALDVFSKMSFLTTHLGTYGFTVATIGALDDPALTDKSFNGPGRDYVFWDSIHPTSKAHAMLAEWAVETLNSAQGVSIAYARSANVLNLTLHNLETARAYTLQVSTALPVWVDTLTFTATNQIQMLSVSLTAHSNALYRVKY